MCSARPGCARPLVWRQESRRSAERSKGTYATDQHCIFGKEIAMEMLLSICVGIGLSAACGFRVFVPLLVMSIASMSGHLTLAPGFQWIGTYPGLVTFSVA